MKLTTENKNYSHFEGEDGTKFYTAKYDGYGVGQRSLEGVIFNLSIEDDGSMSVEVSESSKEYFEQFNKKKFLTEILKNTNFDEFYDGEDGDLSLVMSNGEYNINDEFEVTSFHFK